MLLLFYMIFRLAASFLRANFLQVVLDIVNALRKKDGNSLTMNIVRKQSHRK